MQSVTGVVRIISICGGALASLSMLLMMLHVTIDVGVRYFFNGQIVGTLEIVSFYYMVMLVFLALGYVEFRNENIRVDLFAQMMPAKVQLALYVFACILGMIFFGLLFWQSLHDALYATRRGEQAMSNFRFFLWPARWALPVGFAAVFLSILHNLALALSRRKPL